MSHPFTTRVVEISSHW